MNERLEGIICKYSYPNNILFTPCCLEFELES
uniref:Uncharacterized protein n=1 Tax=Arundo donax TaxID=35708 RepID=A0A0A9FU65_ARUDO